MNIANLSSQISQNIFSKLDTGQQGYLSQEVLSDAFGSMNSTAADTDAATLVTAMDGDSDGKITQSELSKGVENLLSQLSSSMRQHAGGMSPPMSSMGLNHAGEREGVTAEQAAEIASATDNKRLSTIMTQISENFDEVDADEDGVVTRAEGKAFVQSQREAKLAELNGNQASDLSAFQNVAKLISAYGFDMSDPAASLSTSA